MARTHERYPIEKAFAKHKALLRKEAEQTVSGLWSLIGQLVGQFLPSECADQFRSCSHKPD